MRFHERSKIMAEGLDIEQFELEIRDLESFNVLFNLITWKVLKRYKRERINSTVVSDKA